MADNLLWTTAANIPAAVLYIYIALVVWRREVSPDARFARNMFAAFWAALGVTSLLGGLMVLLYMSGNLPLWLHQTISTSTLTIVLVALWALQVYLMYLYAGHNRYVLPLSLGYLALYIVLQGLINWIPEPTTITDNGWQLVTLPRVDLGREFTIGFILVLLGPQIVGAIAYARLYRKTTDRTQRYRIAMLTGAILVWFGTAGLVGAASDPDPQHVNVLWQVLSKILSLGAAVAILMAYKPPRWIQTKYGIGRLEKPGATKAA